MPPFDPPDKDVQAARQAVQAARQAKAEAAELAKPIHVLGAGLSGLAAATYLANAGREVHVHEIRGDSGARFDGDFQGIENWTSGSDFFNEIQEWGFDPDEFKSDAFDVIDLVHPDDEITQPRTSGVAFRIVERGTAEHCIDQGV